MDEMKERIRKAQHDYSVLRAEIAGILQDEVDAAGGRVDFAPCRRVKLRGRRLEARIHCIKMSDYGIVLLGSDGHGHGFVKCPFDLPDDDAINLAWFIFDNNKTRKV